MREPEEDEALGYWRKHPKPDGQVVLDKLHSMGWVIENPPKYYTLKCPCGSHMTQLHLTPSNPRHFKERLSWARRQSCMQEED